MGKRCGLRWSSLMLIFNCTKDAAEFFTVISKGVKHSVIEKSPQKTIVDAIAAQNKTAQADDGGINWHWLVHVITVKRKKVVIVSDYQSRFSMTFTGLRKGDDLGFLNMFEHHLNLHIQQFMEILEVDFDLVDDIVENYAIEHNSCAFYQRGDRSTQALINDVAWHFDSEVFNTGYVLEDFSLIFFDISVNQLLRKRKHDKDYFQPDHLFLHGFLTSYSELNRLEIDRLLKKFKSFSIKRFDQEMKLAKNAEDNVAREQLNQQFINKHDNVISLDAFRKK